MWILYSILAGFFSGLTTFFAKLGLQEINTKLATFIRTCIILIFTILIVFFTNKNIDLNLLDKTSIIYIFLSGIATALLWLSYFKALSLSDINKVTPIDKSSIILTLILSSIILKEQITLIKIISSILIIVGIILMIVKNIPKTKVKNNWLFYAILTSILTSLVTIFGKLGSFKMSVNIVTLFRTIIVFIVLLIVVIIKKYYLNIKEISKKPWLSLLSSGLSTGLSWLFYYKALNIEDASKVFPLEKFSIVTAITLSCIFLKEKLTFKQIIGLIIILVGMVLLIIY